MARYSLADFELPVGTHLAPKLLNMESSALMSRLCIASLYFHQQHPRDSLRAGCSHRDQQSHDWTSRETFQGELAALAPPPAVPDPGASPFGTFMLGPESGAGWAAHCEAGGRRTGSLLRQMSTQDNEWNLFGGRLGPSLLLLVRTEAQRE